VSRTATVVGYPWHFVADAHAEPLPYKPWFVGGSENFELLSYGKDGTLVLTKTDTPPSVPGWLVNPTSLGDSWSALKDGWKWKLVHRWEDQRVVLAGVTI
jgi:hypothetical protein